MPDFSPVYPWIRLCLQDSAPETGPFAIANAYFDPTIKSALRDSVPKAAIVKAGLVDSGAFFDALVGDDKDRLAEAVGLLVAARLIRPLTTGGANGHLLSEKTEQVSRTFAAGPGSKEEWETRAKDLIEECAFFEVADTPALVGGLVIDAAGPSRGRYESRWRDD